MFAKPLGFKDEPAGGGIFNFKHQFIPLVILVIAIPFFHKTNDLYSLGQDQGTYQVKAIGLMNGYTSNYYEMEEYKLLNDDDSRQKYLNFIYDQNNYYIPKYEWETDYDASHFSEIKGTIHGLPTYSAILALWGLIWGQDKMMQVQGVIFACYIFIIHYTCMILIKDKKLRVLSVLLSVFSPICIWLAKSSLTETLLSLLFALFVFLLFYRKRSLKADEHDEAAAHVLRKNSGFSYWALLSFVPLLAFGCVHISLFAFMPVIALVYIFLFFDTGDKGYLIAMALSAVSYALTALMAFHIAPYYTFGNYTTVTKLTRGLINETNIQSIAVIASFIMAIIAVLLYMDSVMDVVSRASSILYKPKFKTFLSVLVRAFLLLSLVYFFYIGVYKADYIRYVQYLQISAYIYLTGLLPIPLIYVLVLLKPEKVFDNNDRNTSVIFILFAYCIVIYSIFMHKDLIFYYYFARYCSMFLFLTFILLSRLVAPALTAPAKAENSAEGGRVMKFHPNLVLLPFIIALISFIPYDAGLIYQKDTSRLEWSLLNEVSSIITSRDAFIVGPDEQQIIWIMPVKFITHCDVFHYDEDLSGEVEMLRNSGKYDHVYYMDYTGALTDTDYKSVWTGTDNLSHLDYRNITNPLTPLPLNYVQYQLELELWELY